MSYKRSRQAYEADIQKTESPFITYGTPLPPLDEYTRDDGSYVPVWKQEVTDDRGRKRLHGAFTGGFSAGYYNTVGSKEGWTPSTFVSSRTNRAKDIENAPKQRAEDFMDEEDIREAEESRNLATTDGFAGFGTQDDAMHRNIMMDLLRPTDNSMGMKLLNKMGWKQGQGIGPRVKRQPDPDDDSAEGYLFAPEDVPMITFIKKTDFKGLGYDEDHTQTVKPPRLSGAGRNQEKIPSDDGNDDRPGFSLTNRTKKDKALSRGGFGVGILNDTGSDEDDPYSMGPKIVYNKTLGGDKKLKKKKQPISVGAANPLLKKKPIFISKKLTSLHNALRKCHDGRLPLQGFVLADELDNFSTMSLSDEKYRPPEVPPGWKPAKASESDNATSILEQSGTPRQSIREAAKSSTHTTTSRAQVLGEAPLPGKSVFDYLTPAARDRLAKATGKTNLPQALSETISGVNINISAKSLSDLVPVLDTETAQQALSRSATGGFMPYAEDLAKRQRYKIFLEYSAGLSTNEPPPRPPGTKTTDEDYINELTEFSRAAEVFRPVSGGLGSRFTSSSVQSTQQSQEGVTDGSTGAESLIFKPVRKPEDPAEVAAKVGMFGPLTRTILTFQPTRLVCKRFGVEYIGVTGGSSNVSTFSNPPTDTAPQTTDMPSNRFHSAGYTTQDDTHTTPNQNQTLNESKDQDTTIVSSAPDQDPSIPSTSIDPDKNEALEQERPGQAVFRAIFGSDSEEDD